MACRVTALRNIFEDSKDVGIKTFTEFFKNLLKAMEMLWKNTHVFFSRF